MACAWGCKPRAAPARAAFCQRLDEVTAYLATSRPTAVNLFWALERMKRKACELSSPSPLSPSPLPPLSP